ncbi:hypothetical protein GOBAR_AA23653 [Gossypium barbadense]|uniref:Uncharacterized protein n=1 Tax=Gossypium barbadense TaxID=3634 RepID=A0A2P5X151_GOSBA|nr:hypothetical protein GOBAR_AA23653 [Gossypium barbadense]
MSSSRGNPTLKKRKGVSSSSGPIAKIHSTAIEKIQLADAIWDLLTTDPWGLFFEIIELTYLELTMELCSTFHPQTNAFTPGTASYNPSCSKASALPPSLRYLHAILAHTLIGRRESNGIVITHDAYFIWCMSHGHVIDLVYFIVLTIQHQTERYRKRVISIGHYVTWLAWYFGLLNTAAQSSSLTLMCQMSAQGISSMLSMRMIEKRHGTFPPQYRLAQSTEEKAPEDITDDVPPCHKDQLSQPPPPSRLVHAAASYTEISNYKELQRSLLLRNSKLHWERFFTTAMSCSTTTIANLRYNILLAQDLWTTEPLQPLKYPRPPSYRLFSKTPVQGNSFITQEVSLLSLSYIYILF